jgi:hypothetical protein
LLVIRAIKAVAVEAAATEMTSSIAEVISVHAGDVTSAETADATSAEATDAASAETTHMASTKAAHMASTAATSMATATATATAGLRVSGKQAAGKHCTCQNHHHSSSHDILLWDGRDFPPQGLVRRWRVRGRQMPTSRWSEDEDTDLSLPLNSRSVTRSAIAGVFLTPKIQDVRLAGPQVRQRSVEVQQEREKEVGHEIFVGRTQNRVRAIVPARGSEKLSGLKHVCLFAKSRCCSTLAVRSIFGLRH